MLKSKNRESLPNIDIKWLTEGQWLSPGETISFGSGDACWYDLIRSTSFLSCLYFNFGGLRCREPVSSDSDCRRGSLPCSSVKLAIVRGEFAKWKPGLLNLALR